MANFIQVMKDWKRMCNAMGQEDEYTACSKCDLNGFDCPAIYEKECNNADWDHVESVVTAWAAEHPEPVYPTWYEVMAKLGVINGILGDKTLGDHVIDGLIKHRIPADIAQKLGIEPKEG